MLDFVCLVDELTLALEQKGIRAGDRIAFLANPSPEAIALFFATWRIGASICPLNPRLPPTQITACLATLSPQLFIDSFPPKHPLRPSSNPLPYPAVLLYTSGSTSIPKIAVLSLESLLFSAKTAAAWLDLRPNDHWLLNLPIHHVSGIGIFLRCAVAGARLVFDSKNPLITHLSAVPTQLYRATPIYQYLRCLLIGGAPIHSYPNRLPCCLSYGLTEMGSIVTGCMTPPRIDGHFSLGHPLPGREVRLNLDGEIFVKGPCLFDGYWISGKISLPRLCTFFECEFCKILTCNQLQIPSIGLNTPLQGLVTACRSKDCENRIKSSSPIDSNQWFATGDIGRYDLNGLTVIGRKDWRFSCGGEKIQPEEVEQALLSLPQVLEAAVVPIQDPEFGHRPGAICCVTDPLFNLSQMKALLIDRLPKYQIPSTLILVKKIPKNGLKIDRKKILEIVNRNLKHQ